MWAGLPGLSTNTRTLSVTRTGNREAPVALDFHKVSVDLHLAFNVLLIPGTQVQQGRVAVIENKEERHLGNYQDRSTDTQTLNKAP